jgi:DNA-binding response OmpR family regulator
MELPSFDPPKSLMQISAMRLLLVEDNDTLSTLLTKGLAAAGFEVDTVTTVSGSLSALSTTRFSAIVLDLGLPDGDGFSVLQFLRGKGDTTPVLILSARDGVGDRVKGLRHGADDYLGKPFALEELVARLGALLRRPGALLGAELRLGRLTFDTTAREIAFDGRLQSVPPREAALLEALLRRSGHVVPTKTIEDQFFGLSGEVDSNTVKVYVHRLRKQLADANADVEVHTIRGVGYLIKERSKESDVVSSLLPIQK